MNSLRQFWAVFKFQAVANPFLWIMPVAFGLPFLIPLIPGSMVKNYHPDLHMVLANQNLFFVGIFGSMILAPEKFQFGGTNPTASTYGSEFLLTRAIDRAVLYRVKVAFIYLLILIIPLIAILDSFRDPLLIANEYSKAAQQLCLAAVPESTLLPSEWKGGVPSLIAMPTGNILVAEWQLAMLVTSAFLFQFLTMIFYPLKRAKLFFWGALFIFIALPIIDLHAISHGAATSKEELFFIFASHQVLFWLFAGLAFLLLQLWCERRFARLEQ